MLAEISTDLNDSDINYFKELFISEISARYPLSTEKTAESIARAHYFERDPNGFFTIRKRIWKAKDDLNNIVGFTVVSEKLGGSIKFGPTIIREEFRNKGFGSKIRLHIEKEYSIRGSRRAYSTTNLNNIPGIFYLTKIGYSIEAHLKNHFVDGIDELVLGKFIDGSKRTISARETTDSKSDKRHILLSALSSTYSGLDQKFINSIQNSQIDQVAIDEEDFYLERRKLKFSIDEENVAVTTPKKKGVVKITPLVTTNKGKLNKLVDEIIAFYSNYSIRKLYGLFPLMELTTLEQLKELGFQIEGLIQEPYKQGVDMVVLAKFL